MRVNLEKGKRVNLCLEKYGKIQMFMIEDIIERSDFVYARIKEITVDNIDSGEFVLKDIESCQVTLRGDGSQ